MTCCLRISEVAVVIFLILETKRECCIVFFFLKFASHKHFRRCGIYAVSLHGRLLPVKLTLVVACFSQLTLRIWNTCDHLSFYFPLSVSTWRFFYKRGRASMGEVIYTPVFNFVFNFYITELGLLMQTLKIFWLHS